MCVRWSRSSDKETCFDLVWEPELGKVLGMLVAVLASLLLSEACLVFLIVLTGFVRLLGALPPLSFWLACGPLLSVHSICCDLLNIISA